MRSDSELDKELDFLFAQEPTHIARMHDIYARVRLAGPNYRYRGGPALIVTGYEDVRRVMSGALPVSNNGWRFGELADRTFSRLPAHQLLLAREVMDFESKFMSRQDGPDHVRLRRIAQRAFSARRIAALRASIQQHTDDLLDALMASDTPDIKTDLADKLPVRVITDLIGVPAGDREMIWQWAKAIAAHFSLTEGSLDQALTAIDEFRGYIRQMIGRLRDTSTGEDLALQLLAGGDREGLDPEELIAMYLLLLFGGTETTTNLIGAGFRALQRHPDQWSAVMSQPELCRPAVEEMLRYEPPVHYLPRYATADFELGGQEVHAGESLLIVIAAANRDPAVFPDPDAFDIHRENASAHLALAFGPHFCLGAALARLEGEIVFSTLARRCPQVRLDSDEVEYGGSSLQRAILSLPVTLPAATIRAR
jgi:cytochrome P450